jgi:hypothetical protein
MNPPLKIMNLEGKMWETKKLCGGFIFDTGGFIYGHGGFSKNS